MIGKKICFSVLCLAFLTACSSEEATEKPGGCLENVPDAITGLEIEGARSERNVIKNLWPLTCRARELYQQRRMDDPSLGGTLILKLNVEFNGEIMQFDIVRSTLEDSEFERRIMDLFRFADLDVYGPRNSESEIIYPMYFKP